MESMDTDSPLAIAAQEFLESRKYSQNLTHILNALDDNETTSDAIQILRMIFMEIFKRRSMLISTGDNKDEVSSVSEYVAWLRKSYDDVWEKLAGLMMKEEFCGQASNALFVLLGQEGKFPIKKLTKRLYYFPERRFQILLKKCFSIRVNFSGLQDQLDEFTNYIDVVYYFWLIVPKILQKIPASNGRSVSHALDILQRIPIPSEDELHDVNEDVLLCFTKNKARFKPSYALLQNSVQNIWNIVVGWNSKNNNHKKTLVFLLENVISNLLKPTLTMDYLMDSLNAGGSISLLALQGIFVLVKDHNLEYPNIYGKLYSFFHPSIFYTKYKNRLYMLTNIFLSSTHLPEMLIASFIKRFSRLCLQAPPQDIIILSAFIKNLLIRHCTLKVLIQHPSEKSAPADPFIENENDPYKTRALESSLWELDTLQQHVLPKVSRSVNFINRPLPNVECDFASLINDSVDKMFENESRKKIQNVSLTFEKPISLALPRTDYFAQMWDVAA